MTLTCDEFNWKRQGRCGRVLDRMGLCDRAGDHADSADNVTAWGRDEDEACQAGTVGCSVNHSVADGLPCEGW